MEITFDVNNYTGDARELIAVLKQSSEAQVLDSGSRPGYRADHLEGAAEYGPQSTLNS
jgi:hypothetical protein